MANNVYITIAKRKSCVQNNSRYRHRRPLQIFPASGPLDYIAMDIIGPFPKINEGIQYICDMMDQNPKLIRAIPTFKTSSTHMIHIFLYHWIIPFSIPNYLLTNSRPQFVSILFMLVRGYLSVRHLTTTSYHPQTNGQAKRFNRSIVTRLRHYVPEHRRDWDLYVQALSCAYNT